MGWIGNIFIVIGLWYIGNKKRWAFVFSMIGEAVWVVYAMTIGLYDLAAICVVFFALAARNYYEWGKA